MLFRSYPEGPPGRARSLYSLLLSMTMHSTADSLKGVEAYIFDVFGTVVDWYGNIIKALADAAPSGLQEGPHQQESRAQSRV